jgi:hypothetical protein
MAETIINRSPAITTREIEIQPQNATPVGTPAGAIGSSLLGPAFVPVTVGTFNQFTTLFGNNVDGERQGVVAAREFLRNGTAFTFLRVLGAGIGGPISAVNVDSVPIYYYDRAGFVAGNENLNGPSGADISDATGTNVWFIGHAVQDIDHSDLYIENILKSGGTYSSGTTRLPNSANDTDLGTAILLRSVVFTSGSAQLFLYSGTTPTSSSYNSDWDCTFGTIGGTSGNPASDSQSTQRQQFVLSVGTTSDPDAYFGPLTCSMDPNRGDYLANVLNTDPSSFSTKGHLFYSVFDCDPSLVTMSGSTGTSITLPNSASGSFIAFSATDESLAARQNNYASRFRAPISPTVISQPIGNTEYDLFGVESLHDGYAPALAFKITVTNISKPSVLNSQPYGTFDIIVRQYNDTDNTPIILEQFTNCTLDPNSESFVGRKVGTRKTFYDFNQSIEEDRKLVEDGDFPNNSNYIRLVLNRELVDGRIPKAALPFGFHGPSVLSPVSLSTSTTRVTIPPVPFRQTISQGVHSADKSRRRNLSLNWGVQFTQQNVPASGRGQDDPNGSDRLSQGIMGFLKMYSVPESNFMVTGTFNENWESTGFNADTYLNNKFSLNNVALMKGLNVGFTVSDLNTVTLNDAKYFRYFRGGVPSVTQSLGDLAALNTPSEIATYNRISAVSSFNFFVQNGFDGTNYQNRESRLLSNLSVRNAENNVTLPGGLDDNTVNAYLHGLNIMSDPGLVSINLFSIPGIKQSIITDRAIQAIENNFDALYIMDIDDRLEANPNQISSVGDVVATFEARSLDSSFAAAYYPDLRLTDEAFGRAITVAPSAPVLGALAFNDRVSSPFEAPAGFNRGVLPTISSTTQRLNKRDRDDLYDVNINPIYQPPSGEFVILGQKTLEANIDSSLNRINVRRLLIELRRQVRQASQRILFEQATTAQLERLENLVTPILDRVQARGGIVQYRVEINDQTTTQTDLNNLTVKGRITIQPTKVIEFINLDFVIDQAGVTFNT